MGQSHSDFEPATVKFLLVPSVHLLHDHTTKILIAMHCNHLPPWYYAGRLQNATQLMDKHVSKICQGGKKNYFCGLKYDKSEGTWPRCQKTPRNVFAMY